MQRFGAFFTPTDARGASALAEDGRAHANDGAAFQHCGLEIGTHASGQGVQRQPAGIQQCQQLAQRAVRRALRCQRGRRFRDGHQPAQLHALARQRAGIVSAASRLGSLAATLPGVAQLMGAIDARRARNDTVVGLTVAGCLCFLLYWFALRAA